METHGTSERLTLSAHSRLQGLAGSSFFVFFHPRALNALYTDGYFVVFVYTTTSLATWKGHPSPRCAAPAVEAAAAGAEGSHASLSASA